MGPLDGFTVLEIAGIGPGRAAYGEQYHRAAQTLAAMTGNVGVHGGWSSRSAVPPNYGGYEFKLGNPPQRPGNPVEHGAPSRKYSLITSDGSDSRARIHCAELADAILKGRTGGYPTNLRTRTGSVKPGLGARARCSGRWAEKSNAPSQEKGRQVRICLAI